MADADFDHRQARSYVSSAARARSHTLWSTMKASLEADHRKGGQCPSQPGLEVVGN